MGNNSTIIECKKCKRVKIMEGRALCKSCYNYSKRSLSPEEFNLKYPKVQKKKYAPRVERKKAVLEKNTETNEKYALIKNPNFYRDGQMGKILNIKNDELYLEFEDGFRGYYNKKEVVYHEE